MKRQAAGYLLTGALAAVVDVGGFALLAPHLPGAAWAAAASFALAAVANYLLSSTWVFRHDWRSLRRAVRFALAACTGLAVNTALTWALAVHAGLPPVLAKLAGVGGAFALNFTLATLWVFGAGTEGDATRPRDACADAPGAGGRTRRRAAGAAAWRPRPSATE
jgi:putative flippase GtrA